MTQHEGEYELPSPSTLDHSRACTHSWSVVFITFIGCRLHVKEEYYYLRTSG